MKSRIKSVKLAFNSKSLFLCLTTIFLFTDCANKVTGPAVVYNDNIKNYTSKVTVETKINSDSYTLLSYGEGASIEDAINQAEKNAFSVLLFNGIANSDLNHPLVENESESFKAHEIFYENFFQKYDFKKFITDNNMVSQSPSLGNRIQVKMRITINLDALKTYLVQNLVTRKFGL